MDHGRREFLKKAATVGWATPLIITLGATAAHGQVSPGACTVIAGRPDGCPCFTSEQCASGCCCSPFGSGDPGICGAPGDCPSNLGLVCLFN